MANINPKKEIKIVMERSKLFTKSRYGSRIKYPTKIPISRIINGNKNGNVLFQMLFENFFI